MSCNQRCQKRGDSGSHLVSRLKQMSAPELKAGPAPSVWESVQVRHGVASPAHPPLSLGPASIAWLLRMGPSVSLNYGILSSDYDFVAA